MRFKSDTKPPREQKKKILDVKMELKLGIKIA
jgi:hypothetical protein